MLEGTLVNLRPLELADAERMHRWINDREVTRFLGMRYTMSLLAEENWVERRASKPVSYSDPFFAIDTKDGEHIGSVNLFGVVPEDRKAELGIMLGEKAFWSKGYGTDALVTLLRFGFDEMNLNRVQLGVYDFNARAQASYRKAGFIEEVRMRRAVYREGSYHDVVLMGVLRDEFYAAYGSAASREEMPA